MARFAATIRFTTQGLQTIQDTTKRAKTSQTAAKKLGVKVPCCTCRPRAMCRRGQPSSLPQPIMEQILAKLR